MLEEDDNLFGCEYGQHSFNCLNAAFYKRKPNATFLDWLFHTEEDRSILYLTAFCESCGLTLDIPVIDTNPVELTVVKVHELNNQNDTD